MVALVNPRKRSTRALRVLLWGGLGAWALWLGIFYVTRNVRRAPRAGEQILTRRLVASNLDGRGIPLLPGDSPVVVLAATSECAACRLGVPRYQEIARRLSAEGVAFRAIVGSDSVAARQFSRLLPEPGSVVWDPEQKLFRSLGMHVVPSLYLVGRDGRLLQSWTPLPSDDRMPEAIARVARRGR